MQPILSDLLKVLELERLEVNLFRGESRDIGSRSVFGGQVLGQALSAAVATINGRTVNSLHAYFLRPGDFKAPIVYEVDRARDGLSFSNRRVTAIQHGHQIFNMAASFQKGEPGPEHQVSLPDVPHPERLPDAETLANSMAEEVPERVRRFLTAKRPFEFRLVQEPDLLAPRKQTPYKQVWFRALDKLPDNEELHRRLLAYVSDYHLIGTALMPHDISFLDERLKMASLDHAMWFHRSVRVDEWLLYSMDCPSTSGGRGLARGQIFNQQGVLVASTSQEGLMRWRD